MLYYLSDRLVEISTLFNVLQYITFRSFMATLTALLLTLIISPYFIRFLKSMQFEDSIRDDGPATHMKKTGTPTMGGIVIVTSILISGLLWGDLSNIYIKLMLFGFFCVSVIGFFDDYLKIKRKNKDGLSGWSKILGQFIVGTFIVIFLYKSNQIDVSMITKTTIPLLKNYVINFGIFYIPFVILIIVGSSNAVNLTDGLDGLATGLIAIAFSGLGIISYISGNVNVADYLHMLYLPGSGELTIIAGSIVGSALGFLWYNAHPAEVFMGDTGSLSLGGAFGIMGVLLKKEFLLIILGGVFVAEALSVILQVGSYKFRKKRIFKMSPIHHHFELKGWHENVVVIRFWIVGILLLVLTLAILKVQ